MLRRAPAFRLPRGPMIWAPLIGALSVACTTTTVATTSTNVSSRELLERGDAQFDGRRYANALEAYKMASVAARGEGDEGSFVEAAAQVAHTYAMLGEPDSGRPWLAQAEGRARQEVPTSWARTRLVHGVYQNADGDRTAALSTFEETYLFALENHQEVVALQAAHLASAVAQDAEQVSWCRRALEVARGLEDPRLTCDLWGQLAWLLEDRRLHDQALEAFTRARESAQATDDPHRQLVADWALGHGLRMTGRLEEARVLMTEVAGRAERRFLARHRPNDAEWVGHTLRELGELDLAQGETLRALARLEQAREKFVAAGIAEAAPRSLAVLDRRIAEVRRLSQEPGD